MNICLKSFFANIFCRILIGELFLSARAMINVTRRQAAVYYLRNTQTNVYNGDQGVKTSLEIEEELFYNFPHLKKEKDNMKNNHDKTN